MTEPLPPSEEFLLYFDLTQSSKLYRPEFFTELPGDKIAVRRVGENGKGIIEIARPSDLRRLAAQYAALDLMFEKGLLPHQDRGRGL